MFKQIFFAVYLCLLSSQSLASEATFFVGTAFSVKNLNFEKDVHSSSLKAFSLYGGIDFEHFGADIFFQQSEREKRFEVYGIDGKVFLPVSSENVKLFGAVGLAYYDFDLEMKYAWTAITNPFVGAFLYSAYRVGAGAEYNLGSHWAVNTTAYYIYLNTPRYTDFEDMSEISFGIKYRF